MISLIRNELIKIIHKPGLFILLALIVIFSFAGAYSEKVYREYFSSGKVYDDGYYESLKEYIDNYDLNDSEQLYWYVSDKSELDFFEVVKDYSYNSPEYYFVENEIMPLIQCMNNNKYIDKDDYAYNECKTNYDLLVEELEKFDWKKEINDKKSENLQAINDLKDSYSAGEIKEREYEIQYENLKFEGDLLDYRLKNEIPYSYSTESLALDTYSEEYLTYSSMNPDESSYKTFEDLNAYREVKANYFVSKYSFENDMLNSEQDDSVYTTISYAFTFSGSIFLIIALIIIFGGLISEEISKGTIKQLLVKPHTRSKILTSKLISGIIAFAVFVILYSLIYMLAYGIFTGGFNSLFEPIALYDFSMNKVIEVSPIIDLLLCFVSLLPMFVIIMLFVLLINILTSNSIASIVGGFVLYFGSMFVIESGYLSDKVFANALLPFVNWDFSYYLYGGSHWFPHCNLGLSIIVCLVTIVALTVGCYFAFNYKDIKNQ